MILSVYTRWATFVLSALGVIYGLLWVFIGFLFFVASGTDWGVLIYLAGLALAVSPMIAHALAGQIRDTDLPVRPAALSALAVLSPAAALWAMFLHGRATGQGHGSQWIAFFGVPGTVLTITVALFVTLAVRAR